jgi:hypothetical protein
MALGAYSGLVSYDLIHVLKLPLREVPVVGAGLDQVDAVMVRNLG